MVGQEDLKTLKILHKDFLRTLPEDRGERYNRIRGNYWK